MGVYVTAILGCLLVGIGEELLFRGFLFDILGDWDLRIYLLIGSLLFGMCHFQQGLSGIMITAIVGAAFGLARIAGMPLVLLVVVHSLIDLPVHIAHDKTHIHGLLAFGSLSYTVVLPMFYLEHSRLWLFKAHPTILPDDIPRLGRLV